MGKECNLDTFADQQKDNRGVALSALETAIVRTLLYFDLFRYPLKAAEIVRTCGVEIADPGTAQTALDGLVQRGLVQRSGVYYFIGEGENYVSRREAGNALAQQRLTKARKVSRFIGKFPYVEAVMVSGSLSKHYMESDSDLDFFVVTRPGRLWIARTFLILYKKIFLLNSHRNFCVNYFVDSDHLEVEDQNIFTATEVAYLLPTCNPDMYHTLRAQNEWADGYYPNFGPRKTDECYAKTGSWWGRGLEKMLRGNLGERLDAWCMKRTLGRWKVKFDHFSDEKFEVTLRTRKYVSKHHPTDYQQKVVGGLANKVAAFETTHQVNLSF